MGKRLLTLVATVAGIALLITGVAFAAGDLAPSDEPSATVDEVTAPTTDTTEAPAVGDEVTAEDEVALDEVPTSPHDGGWGEYISGLRHEENELGEPHTPAAALMEGKTVPGWDKKQPPAETLTTEPPATDEGTTEEVTSQATTGHGNGHGKK